MANGWFRKRKSSQASIFPEGLYTECPKCKELLFTREWERSHKVCLKCSFHFRLTAAERIELLLDPGSFGERDRLESTNPLGFPRYNDSLEKNQRDTGLSDAVVSGEGTLLGHPLTVAVTDSRFMMGSMGSVVGERVTRAVERATQRGIPTLLVSATGGGARMQEGILSLMQMAKTSAALAHHHRAGLLSIVVLTDPTMGGVTASWGSLGDVLLAEPGAMVGFAGLRVSQAAQVHKVPADFQTSEFHLAHGQIDRIVPRKDLRETIGKILRFAGAPLPESEGGSPPRPVREVSHVG